MFLKNKKDATGPSGPAKKGAIPSVIARDMHMLGNIVHEDGMVDVGGTLEGNIRCHTLTLREGGKINGEITAHTVQIYGKVDGLIKAKNVHLFAGCHIEGIVMHEQLSIQDGAYIDGKCKRMDKQSSGGEEDDAATDEAKPMRPLENIRLIR